MTITAGHRLGFWARVLLRLSPQLRREREFLIAEWGKTIKVANDFHGLLKEAQAMAGGGQ